jgi:hypothetical protein
MTIIRLDLSYVVRVVNQLMQTPQKPHLDPSNDIFIFHIKIL